MAAAEGGDDAHGQRDMEIVEVHEGAAKAAGDAGGEAGAEAEAEAGAEAGDAGMASDRSDLLGIHLEEGGALVVLRARSLQVFARGPGGGTMGGTPPAAAGVGAAAPALPEASAPAHVESTAHRGVATTASRPQQRQGRPGAPPRSGPASANQPARAALILTRPGHYPLAWSHRRGRRRCRRRWRPLRPTMTGE